MADSTGALHDGNPVGNHADNPFGADQKPRSSRSVSRKRRGVGKPTLVAARPAVMPGARAVLGALLCVVAALLTLAAYARANRAPTTRYVVAASDLEPGAAIQPGDIELITMRLPAPLRSRAIDRADDLLGATVLGPVAKGELIQIGNVIKKAGGPDSQEFSFPIEAAFAAAGRVRGSDRVDVIATFGSGDSAATEVVAADVLVAHVDRPNASLASSREVLVVTLAVDGAVDTIRLARAVAVGKLMLVRTTGATRSAGAPPVASSTDRAVPPVNAPTVSAPSVTAPPPTAPTA